VEAASRCTVSRAFGPGAEGRKEAGGTYGFDGMNGPAHTQGTGKTEAIHLKQQSLAFTVRKASARVQTVRMRTPVNTPSSTSPHNLAATVPEFGLESGRSSSTGRPPRGFRA
jgi:hypothetical protein